MSKGKEKSESKSVRKSTKVANRGSIKVAGVEIRDGEDVLRVVLIRNGFKISIEDLGDESDTSSSSSSQTW